MRATTTSQSAAIAPDEPATRKHRAPMPSSWRRRIPAASLALAGLLVSVSMARYQMHDVRSIWDPVFGTGSERVLNSRPSLFLRHLLGLPDAALGALAYASETVLALAGSQQRWREHRWLAGIYGAVVAALAMAAVLLVATQAFIVHSWCLLCLISATISLTVFALAWDELRATFQSHGRQR